MPRLASIVFVAALAAAVAACTAMHQFSATQNEKLLRTAGFRVVAADTPGKIESLNTLAPGKISRVGRGGQIYYVFTDPYECRCLWVGQEPQYERYRRLEADEMVPSVELVGIEAGPDWFDDMEPW
jgi:hypothetical protein